MGNRDYRKETKKPKKNVKKQKGVAPIRHESDAVSEHINEATAERERKDES